MLIKQIELHIYIRLLYKPSANKCFLPPPVEVNKCPGHFFFKKNCKRITHTHTQIGIRAHEKKTTHTTRAQTPTQTVFDLPSNNLLLLFSQREVRAPRLNTFTYFTHSV